jgi:hypothetical protein
MINIGRDGIVFLALFGAIVAVFIAFALNASRSKRDLERFGKPSFPPWRAGVLNIIPGLGLWKLGLPAKTIAWNIGLSVIGILAALLWPKWSLENRIQLILAICLGSAINAERTATEMWKRPKQ